MNNDLAEINSKTDALEREVAKLPQVDLQTTHAFSGGMYARTICLQAGTVLTGAVHKTDHINIVIGDISVTTDEGVIRLTGHHVLTTKAGMKRAGFAHAHTMWTTICKTDATEVREAENALVHNPEKLQTRNLELTGQSPAQLEN